MATCLRRLATRLPLATQLVVVQLILIAAVLVAVSAVSVEQTRISFQRDQGQRVLALAEVLAASATVRAGLTPGNESLLPAATTQLQATTGIGLVMVAGVDGVVRASSNPLLVDEPLAWPELVAAPMRSTTNTIELGGQSYLVAAAPVLSDPETTGEPVRQLGIAVVGEENPSRLDALATAAPTLITYLGAAMVLGIVGSLLVARWIKRQTLGLEPAEIAAVVEQREAIFTGIAEGVLALDPTDRVTMVNPLAARLLSLPPDAAGQSLAELKIEGRLRDVLTGTNGDEPDAVVIRSGRVLVLNRSPVVHDGRTIGSVTTLRDRTQLADLESEIGAFRGTTDLLRAQTHEFANQLHTISGLIQIGDYDEVVGYVDALTEGRAALDLTVARRVRDRPVAALLIAKSAVAAERQVSLRVSQQTDLDALEPRLFVRCGDGAGESGAERDRRGRQRVGSRGWLVGSGGDPPVGPDRRTDRQRQRSRRGCDHRDGGVRARVHDQGGAGWRAGNRSGADPVDLSAARRRSGDQQHRRRCALRSADDDHPGRGRLRPVAGRT